MEHLAVLSCPQSKHFLPREASGSVTAGLTSAGLITSSLGQKINSDAARSGTGQIRTVRCNTDIKNVSRRWEVVVLPAGCSVGQS